MATYCQRHDLFDCPCAHDPNDPRGPQEAFYGACGVEQCGDCRPLYDADNNVIAGT